jgi:tetratricopeptide (TPR) repeat protein
MNWSGPFQKMADDLTPYYQERLRWLSPQQRQIIEYLCSQDYSCVPKQIARQLLATESTISGQLKKLLEIGYVLRSEAGRESRYELAEPLMRLASEVKEQQRRPLQLLVNFLRVWYRPEALPELMHRAGTDSLRRHIAAAIDDARTNPDPRIRILVDAIEKARAEGKETALLDALEEKAHTTNNANDWFQFAYAQSEVSHEYENAVQNYDRCLQLEPQMRTAWRNKGLALAKLNRLEEAIACFDMACQLDVTDISAVLLKGNAFYDLERYEDAIYCYDVALAAEPQENIYIFNKGAALLLLNRFTEAVACFDRAIQLCPTNALNWRGKGDGLLALSQHSPAIECYARAIALAPKNSELHGCKGSAHLVALQLEEALVCFKSATELDPQCCEIWNKQGIVLCGLDRSEEALTSYNKALAINPNAAIVWNNKGAVYLLQGQFPAAIECFNNAVALDSEGVLARTNKCEALIGLRCYQEAYEGFEQAICLKPEDAVSWFGRPTCLMALNRWADALRQLRTAFDKFPGTDDDIRKRLQFLQLYTSHGGFEVANSFAALYVEFNAISQLGDGLVRSLAKIDMGTTTPASLLKWRDFWADWGKPHAEMQVPLRLFSAGVEYLIRQDPKVLLDLVLSERQIVAQVLGIETP